MTNELNSNPQSATVALVNGSNGTSGALLITNGTSEPAKTLTIVSVPSSAVSPENYLSTYSVANGASTAAASAVALAASSSTLNLPDSPPDSGSEPPFSPSNETDSSKIVSSTSGASVSNGSEQHSASQLSAIANTSPSAVMDNMKHFVEYSTHSHQLNIKLETSLANMPHPMHPTVSLSHF